jgi:tRNA/tmRNA/rRNA uracil-C5-methylase (TrmA/RlmC/RlmD family)
MYVYPTHDIVSGYLADPKWRQWEQDEIWQVRYALNKQLPAKAQLASSSSDLFIDVGANVGVFTLNIAKTGARVYAFQGESNSSCSMNCCESSCSTICSKTEE